MNFRVVVKSVGASDKYKLWIMSTGMVDYSRPMHEKIQCIDGDDFLCTFVLDSWSLPATMLLLNTTSTTMDTSMVGANGVDSSFSLTGTQ